MEDPVSTEEISEASLARARYALADADRRAAFQADGTLTALVGELREWLEDDRQWISAYARQWVSLLSDLEAARTATGKNLDAFLDGSRPAWQEISLCRAALKKQRDGRTADPAIRRRLQRACEAIAAQLTDPLILGATWDDMMTSTTFAGTQAEAWRILFFIDGQGLDAKGLASQLREILEDDKIAVEVARDEYSGDTEPNQRAGLGEAERAALARSLLFKPARRAEAVIWLKYALAPFSPDMLQLGDTVTLYQARWLRSTLVSDTAARLPPELHGEDHLHVKLLAGAALSDDGNGSAAEDDEDEAIPHVLVRVALGEVPTAEALGLARETAELIVSLATLHGADPSIWILTNSHVSYYDGMESSASFHAPPVLTPTIEQRAAMRADRVPEVVDEWAGDLSPHLPLKRADLRRAAQLALWLRRSREAWEPGRIVLCDRVFEQVAGWAGVLDRGRFIHEHLRLSWALRRVRLEISNCWSGIYAARLNFDPAISKEGWEKIKADKGLEYETVDGGGWSINLRGVLLHLDFLLSVVCVDTPLHEQLFRLKHRTENGKATVGWVNELLKDFDELESRTRRVRNALVHGGPVSDDTARSVLPFVEWLTGEALHTAIKGLLSDGDLIDQFLDRREGYERSLSRLQRNEPPAEALFWEEPSAS
jgi:hypothetical protein